MLSDCVVRGMLISSMRTLEKNPQRNRIRSLERELARYRSLMISLAGQDEEGTYRPEFVERVLLAAEERPTRVFSSPSSFLKDVDGV